MAAIDPRLGHHAQYSPPYASVDSLRRAQQAQQQAQQQQQQQQQQHELHSTNAAQPYYLPPVNHSLQQQQQQHAPSENHNVDPALDDEDDSGHESSTHASPHDAGAGQTPG
jgi:Ca-activated chloride channel family protein